MPRESNPPKKLTEAKTHLQHRLKTRRQRSPPQPPPRIRAKKTANGSGVASQTILRHFRPLLRTQTGTDYILDSGGIIIEEEVEACESASADQNEVFLDECSAEVG